MKKRSKIMLVEDNMGDVVLANEALKVIGSDAELIHVFNSNDAMDLLYSENQPVPDLILLDLNLPGINGIELLQILKKDPLTKNIPVIILSTSSSENDIERCYKEEAENYIIKPIDLNDYFEMFRGIDEFLKKVKRGIENG